MTLKETGEETMLKYHYKAKHTGGYLSVRGKDGFVLVNDLNKVSQDFKVMFTEKEYAELKKRDIGEFIKESKE